MQRQLEREFASITNSTQKNAQKYLKQTQYDLQQALNLFFSADYAEIDKLFDQYKGSKY
jgi:hypothetical protein